MQIQQRQARAVLAGELDAEPTLHRGDEFDVVAVEEDPPHQAKIRQLVLDVQQGVLTAVSDG